MSLLYSLGVRAYAIGANVAALFSAKAKARVEGAKSALKDLPNTSSDRACYWMHCASVGEFEQGRPLWDMLMLNEPEARFVLSFFSPSGHSVFTIKGDVGEVVYLPWDIGSNASEFISRLSPKLAIFVKYEWWLGYFEALAVQDVPTIVISAAFRQNQPFFRPNLIQNDYRKALASVDQIFVQDQSSATLLSEIGQQNFSITGDTRMDRTLGNREQVLDHQLLTAWAEKSKYLLVAGSTWIPDVEIIAEALKRNEDLRLIIAPHEIDNNTIGRTMMRLSAVPNMSSITLSALQEPHNAKDIDTYRAIIVNSIGLLSKLYRLGHIAYIGGGFGAGIHNTLEAMVYGIPLAFGPKHQKFQEAIALVEQNIASVVVNAEDLSTFVDKYSHVDSRKEVLAKAETYIKQNRGATQRIWDYLIERKLI